MAKSPKSPSPPSTPSEEEAKLIERIAEAVVRRQMTVPAILFLESSKPLTFLGSQALHFFAPMVRAFLDRPEYSAAATLFEDRDKVERLLRRIEALEAGKDRPAAPPEQTT